MARRRRAKRAKRKAAIARYLAATSRRKGLFGDDRLWRTVFYVIYARRLWRKLMGRQPEVVAREKLNPGQFVKITALKPEA